MHKYEIHYRPFDASLPGFVIELMDFDHEEIDGSDYGDCIDHSTHNSADWWVTLAGSSQVMRCSAAPTLAD